MNKKFIFAIFLILIAIGAYSFYFKDFKKDLNEILTQNYVNVNVMAFDGETQIETGYNLFIDNALIRSRKTSHYGAILEIVPVNSSFRVETYNLDKQRYYSFITNETLSFQNQTYRVELRPKSIGFLEVNTNNFLTNENKNITLTLSSFGLVQDLRMCSRWSFNVVDVVAPYEKIEKPLRYKNHFNCWDLNLTLNDNIKSFDIFVKVFPTLNQEDWIEFVFIDSDNGITEKEEKDIGMEDLILKIE